MSIQVLPPGEAGKIAAGEVIERPASVVKELVENALDAGATSIAVEVRESGLSLIRVTDDGSGIPPDDLPLAFLRHATSKIRSLADLYSLATLGFRGEALPSIAAVAEVSVISRTRDRDAGAYLELRRGQVIQQGARGAAPGTTVTVRRLFAEVPARLKFLKSPRTELSHISNMMGHLALARPEVHFQLIADGRRVFESPGSGRLSDAIVSWHGAEVSGRLIAVGNQPDGLWGYISPPELSRSTRSDLSLFVNGRWVQNARLAYAIIDAYQGLLPPGRYPLAVLHLRVPPEVLDVNVHPAKAEVRFSQGQEPYPLVYRAVREALAEKLDVPAVTPRATRPVIPEAQAARGAPYTPPITEQPLLGAGSPAGTTAPAPAPAGQPATAGSRLPVMRVLGQMNATFIVAEGPDGIYMVDQHRAHEQILYEALASQERGREPEVQLLLEPLVLHLSPRQRAFLPSALSVLREMGFDLESFGEDAWLLRAVPALLPAGDPASAVSSLIDELLESGQAGDLRELARKGLACRAALKAGQPMSAGEMRELLMQLEGCSNPLLCPHGDPIIVHLSRTQLERQFRRS